MNKKDVGRASSVIGPEYSEGSYFQNRHRHIEDAPFKSQCFIKVFTHLARRLQWQLTSYVDVGCGSGEIVRLVSSSLRKEGFNIGSVKGYDVSPHVCELTGHGVEFVHGDFLQSNDTANLVTLFDVFEHIPDPIRFLAEVSNRADVIALHIPLDDSLTNALRDRYRKLLSHPGHLLFMDVVTALNTVTFAGARVVDYEYTFAFMSPSGHQSLLSRIVLPIRWLFAKVSPWLLSKTLGGVSLLVIAVTKRGLSNGFRI